MSYVYLVFLLAALTVIQLLIGGTRLLYSFPSYYLLGVCGVLTLFSAFRKSKERPDPLCLLSSVVFFTYILVRANYSPIDYLARSDFFMVLGCLLVYFLTAFYLTKTRDRLIVIGVLFGIAVLHLYVGTMQFTRQDGFMLFGFIRADVTPRASGLFISGNHFSGFLEAMGVIGLSLVWWSRGPIWAKMLVGYVAVGCYYGVAISASRGGMLSSLFSLLVLCVLGLAAIRELDREKFIRSVVVCGVVVLVGLAGASFLVLRSTYIKSRLDQQHMTDVRIYNWQASLDQFKVAPLLGTGAGTHLYYGRLFRRPQIQADPVHSHGDYLELIAEYGVIGGIGMALFLLAHLRSGFRGFNALVGRLRHSYIPRSNTLALNIGVLCAVFGLMAHSVVDFNMHIPANALLFAFFFGIITNPGTGDQSTKGSLDRMVAPIRFALPLLGVATCVWAVPQYPGEYFAEKSRVALRDKRFMEAITMGKRALGEKYEESFWVDRLNKWVGGEKKNPFVYFHIGEAYRVIGLQMFNKILSRTYLVPAVEAYKKSLALFPEDENTLVRLGQCYDGLGQFDNAHEAYLKAIRLDPNLGVLYEYYATHLKLQGKKADRAEIETISAKAKALNEENITELGTSELRSQ